MAVGIWPALFWPARKRGPVLLRALRWFAAICRSVAIRLGRFLIVWTLQSKHRIALDNPV